MCRAIELISSISKKVPEAINYNAMQRTDSKTVSKCTEASDSSAFAPPSASPARGYVAVGVPAQARGRAQEPRAPGRERRGRERRARGVRGVRGDVQHVGRRAQQVHGAPLAPRPANYYFSHFSIIIVFVVVY